MTLNTLHDMYCKYIMPLITMIVMYCKYKLHLTDFLIRGMTHMNIVTYWYNIHLSQQCGNGIITQVKQQYYYTDKK